MDVMERNHPVDNVDERVADWVAHGLLSAEQAEAIRRYEAEALAPATPQRLTIVAEFASYLASVIAFAGGAAIVGPNWEDLGMVGQLAVAAAIAAIGFVVGAWLVRLGEVGTVRLGTFLWVVGTGGVALAVAAVMNEIDPSDRAWFAVAIGSAVLVIGAALWRNLDRPLQLLTGSAGLLVAGGGAIELTDVSVWIAASTLWIASLGFGGLAAFDRLRPRLVALAVAAAGVMIGSFMFSDGSENFSAIASAVSAAMIVAFALHDRSWPLVVIGLFAFFIAITAIMQTVLHGMAARLVAMLVGLAIVAYVAVRSQRMGRAGPSAP